LLCHANQLPTINAACRQNFSGKQSMIDCNPI